MTPERVLSPSQRADLQRLLEWLMRTEPCRDTSPHEAHTWVRINTSVACPGVGFDIEPW